VVRLEEGPANGPHLFFCDRGYVKEKETNLRGKRKNGNLRTDATIIYDPVKNEMELLAKKRRKKQKR